MKVIAFSLRILLEVPLILSPKKVNGDSPMNTPSTASMAMRPCLSSDSLYLAKFSLSGGDRPRGSKKPKGPVE